MLCLAGSAQVRGHGQQRGTCSLSRADATAKGAGDGEAAPTRTTRAATSPRNYRPVAALLARRRIVSVSSSNCLLCSCSERYFPDN